MKLTVTVTENGECDNLNLLEGVNPRYGCRSLVYKAGSVQTGGVGCEEKLCEVLDGRIPCDLEGFEDLGNTVGDEKRLGESI